MANLLPVEFKKNVRTEYFVRLGIMSTLSLAVLIVVALALLVPSYIFAESKFQIVTNQLATEKSKTTTPEQEVENRKSIRDINSKLGILAARDSMGILAYDAFLKLTAYQTSRIKIYSFFYTKNEKNIVLSFDGSAETRKSLLGFVQALEADSSFTSVDLPISNFVKNIDINFSIKITMLIERSNNTKNEE